MTNISRALLSAMAFVAAIGLEVLIVPLGW